jgi:hypothetical protein
MEVFTPTGLTSHPLGKVHLLAILILNLHVQIGRRLDQISEIIFVVDHLEATFLVGADGS